MEGGGSVMSTKNREKDRAGLHICRKRRYVKEKREVRRGQNRDTGIPDFGENDVKALIYMGKFRVEKAVENVYNFL